MPNSPGYYLRTNYRMTGGRPDINAFGAGYFAGSLHGGSGNDREWYGGLVYYSFSGPQSDQAYWGVSAIDVVGSYYGSHFARAGFKVMPIDIWTRYASTSVDGTPHVWASVSDSIIMFMLGGSNASALAGTSTTSAAFVFCGFIASS